MSEEDFASDNSSRAVSRKSSCTTTAEGGYVSTTLVRVLSLLMVSVGIDSDARARSVTRNSKVVR